VTRFDRNPTDDNKPSGTIRGKLRFYYIIE
jgi:hypothetical protein